MEYCLLYMTAGSAEEARRIGAALVDERLAACVNVIERVASVYRWKDQVETATEWLLLIKTAAPHFSRVREAIRELHTYELPECLVIPVVNGSDEYLGWLDENTG